MLLLPSESAGGRGRRRGWADDNTPRPSGVDASARGRVDHGVPLQSPAIDRFAPETGLGDRAVEIRLPAAYLGEAGPLAQWLEQPAHNRMVPGSNPGGPTFKIVFFSMPYRLNGGGLRTTIDDVGGPFVESCQEIRRNLVVA